MWKYIILFLLLGPEWSYGLLPPKKGKPIYRRRPPRPPPYKGAKPGDVKNQEFLFTAVSPRIIYPRTLYPVILSLEKAKNPVIFDIKITTIPRQEDDLGRPINLTIPETVAKAQATLDPKTSLIVEVNLEQGLFEEMYNVSIKATSKETEKTAFDYSTVYTERKNFSVVLQTDKPIYKPGEKVQFRVLFLDRHLKPVALDLQTKKVRIEVIDPQSNIVKSWIGKDINFTPEFGFAKGSLQLSKEPNLGEWRIEVITSGQNEEDGFDERQSLGFSVDKYVLPKFKIDVKTTPTFLTFDKSAFTVQFNSTYTHGQGVKGPCTVMLKATYDYQWEPYGSNQQLKPKVVSRTKDIDGGGTVQFDLKKDLKIKDTDAVEYGKDYSIHVSCTEQASGKVQNGTAEIKLYKYPWKIESVNQPNSYKPGFNVTITIKVVKHDGTPVSDNNPEALKIRHGFAYDVEDSVIFKSIPDTGLVIVTFIPPTNDLINVNGIEVTYKSLTTSVGAPWRQTSKTNSYMVVSLLNHNESVEKQIHQIGDTVPIMVQCNKRFSYLNYLLIVKGAIKKWDRISLPKPAYEQILNITLEEGSDPRATLMVYTILEQKWDVIVETIQLDINKPLEDKCLRVEIPDYTTLNKTVEPGTNVTVAWENMESGALIAIRAVDQSVLLLHQDKDIDLNTLKEVEEQFTNGMSSFRTWGGSDIFQKFENMDLNIMTNALLEKNDYPVYHNMYARRGGGGGRSAMHKMSLMAAAPEMDMAEAAAPMPLMMVANRGMGVGGAPPNIRVRTSFPETWIFNEFTEPGTKDFATTVPDTITSWFISGFQISPTKGLGVTKGPTKITVFRPFFITPNLPYSVIKGEIFQLKILIHNYMGSTIGAKVTLENKDNHFTLEEGDGASYTKAVENIESPSVGVVSFLITPTKIGTIMLNIKAVTSGNEAGDGVQQPLIVKPPGVKHTRNDAVFLNLLNTRGPINKKMEAILPSAMVPESETLQITLIGDILGSVMDNLDNLIQLPYGCGEQNMVNFVPDIVVLDYLKTVDNLTPFVKRKTIEYLEMGYQRQLTFKRYDGSYSTFGNSDNEGSTWLTAFVVRSFIQARKYISIDNSVLTVALDFLTRQQNDDGSFVETGYIHDRALQSGAKGNRYALSAYVLLTFIDARDDVQLQDKDNPKDYSKAVDKGLKWLLSSEPNIHDTYSLIMVTYLLHILDHEKKDEFFKKIEERANTDEKGEYMFWNMKKNRTEHHHHIWGIFEMESWWWHHEVSKPANVEMTAYALMIYLMREGDKLETSFAIGRWLLKQRNQNGGFISTQDTVVGITALAKLAKATLIHDYNVKVTVSHDGSNGVAFHIGKENKNNLQEYFLPDGVHGVKIEAEGTGAALAQLSWTYYTISSGNNSGFNLEVEMQPKDQNRRLEFHICATYTASEKSNMAILEVNVPTGYAIEEDDLYTLKKNPLVKRNELKHGGSQLNIYFSYLLKNQTCSKVSASRIHLVAKHSKSSVVLYDYYDTTRKVTKLYDGPPVDVCQICALDDSCKIQKCL